MKFINKTAIITGAGSGIGQSVAIEVASQGANVVVADIDEVGAEETVKMIHEIKGNSIAIPTDLKDHKQIQDLCSNTVEAFGGINLLCYSAGLQTYGTVLSTEEQLWDDTLSVNLKGMYLTAKYCIPEMVRQGGGSIVNISSVQAFACQKNVAAYAASKGGAVALTRAMALDHASDNIRVNCICPGSINTPMLNYGAGKHGNAEEVINEWGNNHPIGRVGKPLEVAKTVMFLWSEDSGFITAQPIIVDGGLISGIF